MNHVLLSRVCRSSIVYMLCFFLLAPAELLAGDNAFFGNFYGPESTPVELLAKKLDKMEKHIDQSGSIVIKTPDVWGESRLMSHRGDIENQLRARLSSFDVRTNAIQSTRDAAFLAGAISLEQQLFDTSQAVTTPTTGSQTVTTNTTNQRPVAFTTSAASLIPDPNAAASVNVLPRIGFGNSSNLTAQIEPVVELDQLHRYLQHLNELRRLNEGDDNSDAPGYALNLIRIPVSVLPGRRTERGFGAEVQITVDPYISDEILPLAWRDFVINGTLERVAFEVFEIASRAPMEDLAKSLDDHYAGRIPGPLLSGTSGGSSEMIRRAGEGAADNAIEPADGITPVPDFGLPREIGVDEPQAHNARPWMQKVSFASSVPQQTGDGQQMPQPPRYSGSADILENLKSNRYRSIQSKSQLQELYQEAPELNRLEVPQLDLFIEEIEGAKTTEDRTELSDKWRPILQMVDQPESKFEALVAKVESFREQLVRIYQGVNPLANINQQDLALSSSYYDSVDGSTLFVLARHAYQRLVANNTAEEVKPEDRFRNGLSMPSVQSLLKTELKAAYEFLNQPGTAMLWDEFCTRELATQVREHRRRLPEDQRKFLDKKHLAGQYASQNVAIDQNGTPFNIPREVEVDPSYGVHTTRARFFAKLQRYFPQAKGSVTASLAWQILVESALLNERLNEDMRETSVLRNCPCVCVGWLPMFGPSPSMEARNAFREYVKCRWPIHVFTLDPVTQDQNISDSFSRRREMQMVAAVAAANRVIGGQGLARYARRLEYDLETIELNRTAISFAHGDNTFGWRFYPRVQAPPVPSTLSALTHDLILGGPSRDSDLRQRKLEPGMRECTALVVMPSFVPQVMVDVRTNWFRLAGHKPLIKFMHRDPGYKDTVELSREVVSLKRLASQCSADAHLYRDGEVYRLCKAIDRLDDRLPLQTHMIPVPWENELGGFSIFRKGGGALEPELQGWYGGPGIVVTDSSRSRNSLVLLLEAEKAATNAQLALSVVPVGDSFKEVRDKKAAELEEAGKNVVAAQALHAAVLAANTSTTVFLVGKNFSVLNAHVIAGGVDVSETIHVINRRLLSVRIPSNASTVTPAGFKQPKVAVNLSTPHGATTRLLIPAVTDGGSTANTALEAVKKTADDAKKLVSEISERSPVALQWGTEGKDLTLEADVTSCATGISLKHFSPTATEGIPISVVEQKKKSPWTTPVPASGPFTGVDGELAVYVKVPGKDDRIPVRIGGITNGSPHLPTEPTTGELLQHVLEAVRGEIPCRSDKPVEIVVEGFVRYNASQPVIRIANKITYKLTIAKPVVAPEVDPTP